MSSPKTKSAQRPKSAASSMRVRTSSSALPRSIRPRETRTSAQVRDAEDDELTRGAARAFAPGQRSPTRSVPTSIASELLRGLGPPLGSPADLDVDQVERLSRRSVSGPGSLRASAEIGWSRHGLQIPPLGRGPLALRQRLPPRGPRACRCDLPKGGIGRVTPRDTGGRRVAGGPGRATACGTFSPNAPNQASPSQVLSSAPETGPMKLGPLLGTIPLTSTSEAASKYAAD